MWATGSPPLPLLGAYLFPKPLPHHLFSWFFLYGDHPHPQSCLLHLLLLQKSHCCARVGAPLALLYLYPGKGMPRLCDWDISLWTGVSICLGMPRVEILVTCGSHPLFPLFSAPSLSFLPSPRAADLNLRGVIPLGLLSLVSPKNMEDTDVCIQFITVTKL